VEVHRIPFACGEAVRVTGGVFRGAVGTLLAHKAGYQLVISISLLQRSVAVEIDEALVEPVRHTAARGAA
jgi:transcription antitermination factor NusG